MPSDPPAILTGYPTYTPAGVPTLKFRVHDTSVALARDVTGRMLHTLVDDEHLADLKLCVSELVTNALRAARQWAAARGFFWEYDDTPVHLGIACGAQWTRLDVRDPDPAIIMPRPRDPMDESGRGLQIVETLAAAVWPTYGDGDKTMHALIAMPGVTLTAEELWEARRLEAGR